LAKYNYSVRRANFFARHPPERHLSWLIFSPYQQPQVVEQKARGNEGSGRFFV